MISYHWQGFFLHYIPSFLLLYLHIVYQNWTSREGKFCRKTYACPFKVSDCVNLDCNKVSKVHNSLTKVDFVFYSCCIVNDHGCSDLEQNIYSMSKCNFSFCCCIILALLHSKVINIIWFGYIYLTLIISNVLQIFDKNQYR